MNSKEKLLKNWLSDDEYSLYSTLVKEGKTNVVILEKRTVFKKSLIYNILAQLIEKKLVEKSEYRKVSYFEAVHPSKVLDIFLEEKEKLEHYEEKLRSDLSLLVQEYNHHASKPNIRFFEGINGIKTLYNDILDSGDDILLVRSRNDNSEPEFAELVKEQIVKQKELGITTRALTPLVSTYTLTPEQKEKDLENGVKRYIIDYGNDAYPQAQIIIYGDNVSFTTFGKTPVTTIIENSEITQTMKLVLAKLISCTKPV